jgi:benzil reductase ((S)-benzoin forming)
MASNIFITGVSSGLGLGLAKAFLNEGPSVFGLSRREPTDLRSNPNFKFQELNLANFESIPAAVKNLLSGLDKLDLVILNAGILGRIADLKESSIPEMQQVMDVNLWANKMLIDSLFELRIPIQQIVAISSGAAVNANRGWNAYAISKAALNMLMALYATEQPGTHFCALAPGIVDTPMQDQISNLPQDPRFSSLEMLRQAKGTPMMPKPDQAAARLIDGISKATKYPSGSFLDLNSIVKRGWKG